MGRPNMRAEQRTKLIPIVARAFAELGYGRATTAELARRCETQEAVLYRLWDDKPSMFAAAIDHVVEASVGVWNSVAANANASAAPLQAVLEHEGEHLGENGLYRLLFAGVLERAEPRIGEAIARAYRAFHRELVGLAKRHRGEGGTLDHAAMAWGMIGLGTAITIGRELDLLSSRQHKSLLRCVGEHLIDG